MLVPRIILGIVVLNLIFLLTEIVMNAVRLYTG